MSSRAGKMEKQVLKAQMPEQKTKSVTYRIDVNLAGECVKTTYMVITGVPEDLPEEYENTVRRTAEAQFCNALNERKFLEFYNEGKNANDEQPKFINISSMAYIQILSVTKVK